MPQPIGLYKPEELEDFEQNHDLPQMKRMVISNKLLLI
jgi:hypothetical protein